MQVKLSTSQYRFRAGVSMETALHEFVHREEHCLLEKSRLWFFFLILLVTRQDYLPWFCSGSARAGHV